MHTEPTKLTASDLRHVLSGGAVISGNGQITANEGRFVMVKFVGKMKQIHTLDIGSTDLPRLNAHWQQFAA